MIPFSFHSRIPILFSRITMSKNIIAIDFGTTNTYITLCPHDSKNKTPLHLSGKTPAISTVILYLKDPNADPNIFPIIGEEAVETFGDCDNDEIGGYRYCSHFKPDIEKSKEAQKHTIDFFQAVLRDARKQGIHLKPENSHVIIGVPSEANAEYRRTLKSLAKTVGFGDVELVDEPKGAMINDIGHHQFDLGDIMSGYLVIDFGGGTCDFAFIKDGVIKHSWGAMHLGGRLFDDLFYQWFCETNPGMEKELEASGADFYVRTHDCRTLKEWFSDGVGKNPEINARKSVGKVGRIEGLTKDEFLRRAKNYTPSRSFLEFQKRSGAVLPPELQRGKVDLIDWFEHSLFDGLSVGGINIREVQVISLAGGSSRWFFVKESCLKKFNLGEKKISTSPNPFAAISEGLAILPAVEAEFAGKVRKLKEEKPQFVHTKIRPEIRDGLRKLQRRVVDTVMHELFTNKIAPRLHAYRQNGGTINQLEQEIATDIRAYEPHLKRMVDKEAKGEIDTLLGISIDATRRWLTQHGIHLPETQGRVTGPSGGVKIENGMTPVDVGPVVLAIQAMILVVVTTVIAKIVAVTGITLLSAAGPLGLLTGAIAGAAVLWYGQKATEEWVKANLSIPAFILTPLLTDAKIKQCRTKMNKDLDDNIAEACSEVVGQIEKELDQIIQKEIDRLSIVNIR